MRTATSSWVGAGSNNVLRFAPRGDRPSPGGDAPCVAEIFNPSLASKSGFQFAAPKGIAVASDGTVYVTGTGGNLPPPGDPAGVNDDVVGIFPDGTIRELANRDRPETADWNPSGIAIDEQGDEGVFVYATGPAGGGTVRMGPDGTADRIFTLGGQGVALDTTGNAYVSVQVAMPDDGPNVVYQIPDARHGICGEDGKECSPILSDGDHRVRWERDPSQEPIRARSGWEASSTPQDRTAAQRRETSAWGRQCTGSSALPSGDIRRWRSTVSRSRRHEQSRQMELGTSMPPVKRAPTSSGSTRSDGQDHDASTGDHQPRLRDRFSPSHCSRLARQRLRLRQHHEQRVPHSNDYSRPRMRRRREGAR